MTEDQLIQLHVLAHNLMNLATTLVMQHQEQLKHEDSACIDASHQSMPEQGE